MRRTLVCLVIGIAIGQLDPIGRLAWLGIESRLPETKRQSLAAPSPFEEMPPSRWVAESEHAFVIDDRYAPTAPVHMLVVPKRRYTSVLEAPPELLGEMLELARRAARERGIAESGFRIVINTNPEGGQTVYHLHVHVKGGRQLREPLLPLLWSRIRHS
ncbi:MAG: HIT domain-containing protein [Myxococcota bacterium]|nr:HIT domain-containing protein [Myxococcota bacterium]